MLTREIFRSLRLLTSTRTCLYAGLAARRESPAASARRSTAAGLRCSSVTNTQFAPASRIASRAHRRSRCHAAFHHGLLAVSVGALLSATACGAGPGLPAMPGARAGGAAASADALYAAGLEQFRAQAFAAAAGTLDQCIAADPTRAYAYYYAGMAYRRINRVDLMAARFEMFVRLAPDAPERPQVEAILQTVRG